jgi:hypothetical protein
VSRHLRGRNVAATLWFLVVVMGSSLEAQRVEPKGIRGARRPHAELPPGNTSHAAAIVDDYFDAYWKQAGVTPAPLVDDATFLRRASLALHGVPATADEVTRFLADDTPKKRSALVDSLLTRSRYADYWGFRLRSWITEMREMLGQSTNIATLYFYTREAMAENRSWSRIAKELLATEGEITYRGYANFALYFDCEANEVAEAASRLFLGVNLSCAQCHDHPHVDALTQESYWGFAAYFAKISIGVEKSSYEKRFPDIPRNPAGISTLPGGDWSVDGIWGDDRAILDNAKREVKFPDPKNPRVMKPTPLGGAPVGNADEQKASRRFQLVAWMTSRENLYFARAAVNRFWNELTGLGFVDAVDGFTPEISARHRELLDNLAWGFNANRHDVKWLLRTVVLSRIFQQEYREDPQGRETWAGLFRRPLNSDQWHDSVLRATGEGERIYNVAEEIAVALEEEHRQRVRLHEKRVLLTVAAGEENTSTDKDESDAVQSAHDDADSPERKRWAELRKQYDEIGRRLRETRKVLRMQKSPTNEALLLMNGELVATSLREGLASYQIAKLLTPRERLDRLYLATLGRLPSETERGRLLDEVREPNPKKIADVLWALLQSTEFLTY